MAQLQDSVEGLTEVLNDIKTMAGDVQLYMDAITSAAADIEKLFYGEEEEG